MRIPNQICNLCIQKGENGIYVIAMGRDGMHMCVKSRKGDRIYKRSNIEHAFWHACMLLDAIVLHGEFENRRNG